MHFWRLVKEVIAKADIVLLIVDARMPELSRNKDIEYLADNSGKIFRVVFNKIDLLSKEAYLDLKNNYKGFFVSATNNKGISSMKRALLIEGKKMKLDSPKIGVVGYPNVGKSAVINALAHRERARVSQKAGTTRGIQWIKAGSLRILDSPGVIPFEDRENALAFIGSKQPERLKNPYKVAIDIIDMFLKKHTKSLEEFYGIKAKEDAYETMLEIGRRRGFLSKGGIVDEKKTALHIIQNWQKGKLSFK